MSDVYIDLNQLTTFNAPLKTVSENILRGANNYAKSHDSFSFGALNPELYNTVALMYFDFDDTTTMLKGRSVIGNFGATPNAGLSDYLSSIGAFRGTSLGGKYFTKPAKYDDWCFFYELKKINQRGSTDPLYDNVEQVQSTFYYRPTSTYGPIGAQTTDSTPQSQMGIHRWCVIGNPMGDPPPPTNNYDDWYYVSKWNFYNRAAGSSTARTAINSNYEKGVFPIVLWDIQNITRYGRSTSSKPYTGFVNGNYQGFILLNPRFAATLGRLADWRLISTFTRETLSTSQIIIRDQYKHKSTLGDNIKILIPDDPLKIWVRNENETIYDTTPATQSNPILAFKSEEDFLALLNDWGITRVTNDIDEAQKKDGGAFPGHVPEGDGFTPDGGNPEGYDTNPAIPSIPSYPDNTSDRVTPTTPNISAINAASVYALSLSGVKTLLNWLMSEGFTKNISELFSDKLSAIDDLKIMPFDIVNHDTLHALYSDTLTIANVTGNVVCHKIQPNYNCIINGGSYHYTAYWGDYNDYTAASYYLYIPYGGIVELSPSFVVNRDLRLEYALDIMTGNATAIIYSNDVFVKTVPCQMGQTVPITYTNTNQREIKNTLAALNAGTTLVNMAAGKTDIVGGVLNIGNTVAKTALTNPLTIGSIGNFGANTSLVMPQNPFLIISRIQQSIPANMDGIIGRPSNTHNTIGAFVGSGFVQISADHINTTATTAEQEQIISLLQGGIYL